MGDVVKLVVRRDSMFDFAIFVSVFNKIDEKNEIHKFCESDYVQDASTQKSTAFRILKKTVKEFCVYWSGIRGDVSWVSIAMVFNNRPVFESKFRDPDRLDAIEGFKTLVGACGGADDVPASGYGYIDTVSNIRVEYIQERVLITDL